MAPVRRIAQIVHLKPAAVAAYKECHANVWPEVLQQIKDCNIKDCRSPNLTTEEEYPIDLAFFRVLRLNLLRQRPDTVCNIQICR